MYSLLYKRKILFEILKSNCVVNVCPHLRIPTLSMTIQGLGRCDVTAERIKTITKTVKLYIEYQLKII